MNKPLNEVETKLLRAMWLVEYENAGSRSVVTLRYALLSLNRWDSEVEGALCKDGIEHDLVAEYYRALRRLVMETPFAKGRGNFESPIGPRFTDVRITKAGKRYLSENSIGGAS